MKQSPWLLRERCRFYQASKTKDGFPLPQGWQEVVSPARGVYFYHKDTGITQWELPTGPPTERQRANEHKAKFGEQISQLKPGLAVELRNLMTAPQLNGRRGICERWEHSSGKTRIVVRLETGELKAVKPECVFPQQLDCASQIAKSKAKANTEPASAHHSPNKKAQEPSGLSWKTTLFIGLAVYGIWTLAGRFGHVSFDFEKWQEAQENVRRKTAHTSPKIKDHPLRQESSALSPQVPLEVSKASVDKLEEGIPTPQVQLPNSEASHINPLVVDSSASMHVAPEDGPSKATTGVSE